MNQNILCENCAKTYENNCTCKRIQDIGRLRQLQICSMAPLESMVMQWGKALRDYLCDYCGRKIRKDERCTAVSIMGAGVKYRPWEHGYLTWTQSDKQVIYAIEITPEMVIGR